MKNARDAGEILILEGADVDAKDIIYLNIIIYITIIILFLIKII